MGGCHVFSFFLGVSFGWLFCRFSVSLSLFLGRLDLLIEGLFSGGRVEGVWWLLG